MEDLKLILDVNVWVNCDRSCICQLYSTRLFTAIDLHYNHWY